MQASIWYDFLRLFENDMRVQGRYVLLLSDNASSHADPLKPPENYQGPPPPLLVHVKLVYIAPNMTAFVQPLDAGIIASFKATYRRMYAREMVKRYSADSENFENTLDVYDGIMLAVAAWREIPASTIFNCWQKTGIIASIVKEEVGGKYEAYIKKQEEDTAGDVASMLAIDGRAKASGPGQETPLALDGDAVKKATAAFMSFDEDKATEEATSSTISQLVKEVVEDGIKSGLHKADFSPIEPESDSPSLPPPPRTISTSSALSSMDDLCTYFQHCSFSSLDTLGGKLEVSDIIETLQAYRAGFKRHSEAAKTQKTLSDFVTIREGP